MNEPMMGCSGCATTGGRMACPVHGAQATAPVTFYDAPITRQDVSDIKRSLNRIISLLERIAGVAR